MANKMPLSIPADEPILLASRSCEEHKDEDTEEVLILEVDPIPEISDLPIHVVPVRNVWEMPRIWDLDAISK
jgi:hypothetical protein